MKLPLRSTVGFIVAALGLGSAAAQEQSLQREDFGYARELATQSGYAAYKFTLPLDVYLHTASSELDDIRILNANGEVVPYSMQRLEAQKRVGRPLAALPLFALRGDPVRATQALRLKVNANGTSIELQREGEQLTELPITGYLFDARAVDSPLSALDLAWAAPAKGFSTHATVEASDDLASWRAVALSAPLVDLSHASDRLQQKRIEFGPTQAKFWRLRWTEVPGPIALTGATAVPVAVMMESSRYHLRAVGEATDRPGEFRYALRIHTPIDRINLELPDLNSVAEAQFFVPGGKPGEWRTVWSGTVYSLRASTGSIDNKPIEIPPVESNEWRVRIPARESTIPVVPALIVGWLPHELTFIARGEGPYELVYGNSTARSAAIRLNNVLSTGENGKPVSVGTAEVGREKELGGAARLQQEPEPLPWRTMLLWSVLVIAVGLLGFMAWKLARQMRQA